MHFLMMMMMMMMMGTWLCWLSVVDSLSVLLGRLLRVDLIRPHNISGSQLSIRPRVRPSVRPQKVSSISMTFGV